MDYVFYFDESFHDRKIKLNNDGKLNTMNDNSLDSYIGVFCGFEQNAIHDVVSKVTNFEIKYKEKLGLSADQELKSTTIHKKNFQYGVASFNKMTFHFYRDFFEMVEKLNPILQIEIISKVEHFLHIIFSDIVFDRKTIVNESLFFYSFTKFFLIYNTPELLSSLFNVRTYKDRYNLKKQLLNSFKIILPVIKKIPRKPKEYAAFQQLYKIIRDSSMLVTSSNTIDFSYYPNYIGLSLLLNEMNIAPSNVSIVLDNEEKTFEASNDFNFKSVVQADSNEIIQLHLCDIISGFIGRIVFALFNDKNMTEDPLEKIDDVKKADLIRKRILSANWFKIDRTQYELYLLLYRVFIQNNTHYWATLTSNYGDHASCFYSLLRYFSSYESFDKFSTVSLQMHAEYFNYECVQELEKHYKKMEARV